MASRIAKASLVAGVVFAMAEISLGALVGYYPLNELNGTAEGDLVTDASGNSRNMQIFSDDDPPVLPQQGIASANAALYGTAYSFNTPADALNYADTVTGSFSGSGLTRDSALTYAAWIKPAANQISLPTILGSNGRGYDFRIAPSGSDWSVVLSAGNNSFAISSAATIESDVWTHVAVTKDVNGSSGTNRSSVNFYINGVLVESGDVGRTTITQSPVRFFVGTGSQITQYYSGGIDEARIYNEVLDASTIAGLAIVPEPCSLSLASMGLILAGSQLRKRGKRHEV